MAVTVALAPPGWSRHPHYVPRLVASLLARPSRPVGTWRETVLSAGELARAIVDIATSLRHHGVGRGWTVAILTTGNHPISLAARHATHLIGATAMFVRSENPRIDATMLPAATQMAMLRATGAQVLFVDAESMPRARELRDALAAPGLLACYGHELDGARDLSDTVGAAPLVLAEYQPEDVATVGYTSGSAGEPMGFRQSYATWNSMVRSFVARPEGTSEPATLLAVTPAGHTIASMIDSVLIDGGRLVVHDGFAAADVVEAFVRERVTDTYLAVPHLYQLLDHLQATGADAAAITTHLRRLVYSGSPAAPHKVAQAAQLLPASITQLYGSSEGGGITALTPADHREPELLDSVGRPFPLVRVRLIDPATGDETAAGEIGEVWVNSPMIMQGYLVPDPRGDSLRDGWLRTGDLGWMDRYGYLHLAGRVHGVIKSGGIKVYPATVESVLMRHPAIAHACVFAVPDTNRVEHIHAAVTLRDGCTATMRDLAGWVSTELSPNHAPSEIGFWDRLPLTAAGKPDTARMRLAASIAEEAK